MRTSNSSSNSGKRPSRSRVSSSSGGATRNPKTVKKEPTKKVAGIGEDNNERHGDVSSYTNMTEEEFNNGSTEASEESALENNSNLKQDENANKKKSKKQESNEEKKKRKAEKRADPMYLKPGRIVLAVFLGCLFSLVFSGIVYRMYMSYVKYPSQEEVDLEKTGIYCLNGWIGDIQSLVGSGEEGYISQEVVYANGDGDKIAFFKKMAETVNYSPKKVVAKNVYGNDMVNSRTDEVVYIDSYIDDGEEVELSYIDYTKLDFDRQKVKELLDDEDLRVGDVDYPNKLVKVFCRYMCDLDVDEIPLKVEEKYVPNMVRNKNGTYSMTDEEDTYIDKVLYSSEELRDLMERFSAVAGGVDKKNPKWVKWNKLPKKKKAKKEEPEKLGLLSPTKAWSKWKKLPKKKRLKTEEPKKYNWKEVMSTDWCGVYYLQNERVEIDENGVEVKVPITAEIGDGTFENPAGMDTPVLTYVFNKEKNKKGKVVTRKRPIKVQMVEYGVSDEAVKWFESKDEKNRGIDLESEVQYCYYIIKVTNMSNKKLKIKDNTVLCDSNANIGSRTGIVYGLRDVVTLKPDESGLIETWGRSTELNKKYVVWGKDFERREKPVWFRVLAGNIDDPSEDKGVRLNKSRDGNGDNETSVSDNTSDEDSTYTDN